jgi:hypothetical protein
MRKRPMNAIKCTAITAVLLVVVVSGCISAIAQARLFSP